MKKNLLLNTVDNTLCQTSSDIDNHGVHEAMQAVFNNIEIGLERVSNIVHKMSIANEPSEAEQQSLGLNACVDATTQKLAKQFGENINVELSLTKLPHIFFDAFKISQLLSNLLINANEAIKDQGEIRIATAHKGRFIEISVSDNGCGIKPHLQELIFDPFYSTKKDAAKIGLGLAISKDIAHEQGGDLQVSSTYRKGSIFTLQLPVEEITIH